MLGNKNRYIVQLLAFFKSPKFVSQLYVRRTELYINTVAITISTAVTATMLLPLSVQLLQRPLVLLIIVQSVLLLLLLLHLLRLVPFL